MEIKKIEHLKELKKEIRDMINKAIVLNTQIKALKTKGNQENIEITQLKEERNSILVQSLIKRTRLNIDIGYDKNICDHIDILMCHGFTEKICGICGKITDHNPA